ncbi:hypothetical protein BCAR13_1640033 [Paraburkholderia caribensis]|nr:hypothetical protein BCAR13_1640033 [Paraburkholderia caribensis]
MAEIDYGEGFIVGKILFFLNFDWDMAETVRAGYRDACVWCRPGKGLTSELRCWVWRNERFKTYCLAATFGFN